MMTLLGLSMVFAIACSSTAEPEVIVQEVIKEVEVVKEVVHEHAANPGAKQDEVNTDLPAGPHGTTFVEPPVKSEDYTKAYGDKKSVHKQVKRNEIVGEKRTFSAFRSIAEKK